MKVFTALIINLALASSAIAAAVDSRMALSGLEERACGANGVACLAQADCCLYCNPEAGWTCTDAPSGCVATGLVPAFGQNSCCTRAVDANGACT
ncbi:hypothetical protein KVR01_004353 [Diaporthe batatas]|uniref:uncharacterized protein n=1 Tax=Diaporthe batatas TaxID=748121 RepID=UPI001D059D2D|nr:uncharacterized protein KVR01_004353 [Diaporthe batatas]KAG8165801.1 hypothetical protein KVR01_004353 [Diaporthe batatas]